MSKDNIGNTTDKLEGQRSQSSISFYTEVFKKATWCKSFLTQSVKVLKKGTNIDLEKDSYFQVRDVVTTSLHNT